MQLTIHIGAPKTGSTALQRFLSENRGRLAANGVLYPDVSLRGYGHHDLAFLLHGSYPPWATPQPRTLDSLMEDLVSAMSTPGICGIVLSSEDFYIYPAPERLRECLHVAGMGARDSVRVVVYLRRQDEAHISWHNQAVKAQGYSGSIEDSLRDYRDLWDYRARLSPWLETFGREALAVRILRTEDIRRDFLSLLDISPEGFDFTAPSPNDRINRDILEYQRLVNREPISPQEKRRFHKALIELTAATAGADIFDDTPVLGTAGRSAVMQEYAESNADVARTFLDCDELFATDAPQGEDAPVWPGLTPQKIARITEWIATHGNTKNQE